MASKFPRYLALSPDPPRKTALFRDRHGLNGETKIGNQRRAFNKIKDAK
jgi:hypothetical protein